MAFILNNKDVLTFYKIYETAEFGNNYAFVRKVMADYGLNEQVASIIWQSFDAATDVCFGYVKGTIQPEKKTLKKQVRFQCRVCGHMSAGRKARHGDGTFYYPRKHYDKKTDEICDGCFEEATWVTQEVYV